MTADDLTTALRACAAGFLYPHEAGVALLAASGTFLHRPDFTSISDGTTLMAGIDRDAAITALHAGELPCSGGERRILEPSSSLAGGIPSTSATPSPASTTATSPGWPPASSTHPENDRRTADIDDRH